MITILISSLIGAFALQVSTLEDSWKAVVTVLPPGSTIYLEFPLFSLRLTPSTRMFFRGERFTVQCPPPQINSTGWRLKHFSPSQTEGATVAEPVQCPPHDGAASAGKSDMCSFVAARGNSGLYWCESSEGRSSAVNIAVSYDDMILKTPAFPVFEGDEVVLCCQSLRANNNKQDEGYYKCASLDRKMQSAESWLAVRPNRGNFTSTHGTEASTSGSWKWILLSCGVILLCITPLTIWLIYHHRNHMFCTKSCWPLSKEDVPAVALPATKQDVTEVQWDLSWMEMSNLLDKHLYPGT
ncbi:uncharacterized protein LOC115381750 isoform X2 [Salarias fasciatus]|uniref:uncharacterized protein LOC115381750 isoform X2 n=1 Tax=Salarias fasciatus TaxID=181472 RepID=UPI001176D545|nr:uncharacterized protein LOC115381750 isoform X2 [Salarias fasciatus]